LHSHHPLSGGQLIRHFEISIPLLNRGVRGKVTSELGSAENGRGYKSSLLYFHFICVVIIAIVSNLNRNFGYRE
jgi:hypothetical protein